MKSVLSVPTALFTVPQCNESKCDQSCTFLHTKPKRTSLLFNNCCVRHILSSDCPAASLSSATEDGETETPPAEVECRNGLHPRPAICGFIRKLYERYIERHGLEKLVAAGQEPRLVGHLTEEWLQEEAEELLRLGWHVENINSIRENTHLMTEEDKMLLPSYMRDTAVSGREKMKRSGASTPSHRGDASEEIYLCHSPSPHVDIESY